MIIILVEQKLKNFLKIYTESITNSLKELIDNDKEIQLFSCNNPEPIIYDLKCDFFEKGIIQFQKDKILDGKTVYELDDSLTVIYVFIGQNRVFGVVGILTLLKWLFLLLYLLAAVSAVIYKACSMQK